MTENDYFIEWHLALVAILAVVWLILFFLTRK